MTHRTSLALLLSLAAGAPLSAPAHAVPAGARLCGLVAVSDPTAGGTMTGLVDGGPIGDPSLPTATVTLACSVHAGAGNATHAGSPAAGPFASQPGTGVAVLPPTQVSFPAPEEGVPVYLCTQVRVATTAYYWNADGSAWSTAKTVGCALSSKFCVGDYVPGVGEGKGCVLSR